MRMSPVCLPRGYILDVTYRGNYERLLNAPSAIQVDSFTPRQQPDWTLEIRTQVNDKPTHSVSTQISRLGLAPP